MNAGTTYLTKDGLVVAFEVSRPLEIRGTVDLQILNVRNGVHDPSDVVDILPEGIAQQVLDDHLAAGYQVCNRFGRLLDLQCQPQVAPPPDLRFQAPPPVPPPPPTSHQPVPDAPARDLPKESDMPTIQSPPSLQELLQKIREKIEGWESLSTEEQRNRRQAIYGLRAEARKVAKAAGVAEPELPEIPKVRREPEPDTEDSEKALEDEQVSVESIQEGITDLKRSVWSLMVDVQSLSREEQRAVAHSFHRLAYDARAASSALMGGSCD